MGDETDYSVEFNARARTAVLRGVMRLEHEAMHERIYSPIAAELDTAERYTIDVSDVVYMNSSGIRLLATLVQSAKRSGRRLVMIGRRTVPWQSRTLASFARLYAELEIHLVEPAKTLSLRREGELWAIESLEGRTLRLKDSKGLSYLECLVAQPGKEVHVLEMVGMDCAGDGGPVLDDKAKVEYRDRLRELRATIDEAERFHDGARVERAREEMEAITAQLAEAIGPGGRDRRLASDVQRARINVQRCVKETLERIEALDPTLGRYLGATVKTGTYCSFKPLS